MEPFVLYYPTGHQAHSFYGHPEKPDRVEVIKEGLMDMNLWDVTPRIDPIKLEHKIFSAVHDQDYLDLLEQTCSKEEFLDPDTYTTRDSWQLALNAAGGAAAVAGAVWEGKYQSGFALSRPPGHHATRSRGMGFCLINNIAVSAEYLLQAKGAERIAIIDLDLHHGNGTQDIFWDRPEVSYVSIHQAPFYPGTGSLSEVGIREGEGYNLNLPIPIQSGDLAYQTLICEIVIPFLDQRRPEILLISYGFDTHWKDPLGSMQVSAEGTRQMLTTLRTWAMDHCFGRLVVILEGGYDLDAGRVCGQAVASSLTGKAWIDSIGPSPLQETEQWRNTLELAKKYWG